MRSHIDHFRDFINLIYELREISVHKQGFKSIGYKQSKTTNSLEINKDIVQLIKRCGDKIDYDSRISNWGIFNSDAALILLEPYHFARSSGLKLGNLSDRYLELLGFNKFIDTLNPKDSYLKSMKIFEQYSLGRIEK